MRCKKHPSDLSSTVGVCASCLRERLFALIAAQVRAAAAATASASASASSAADDHRKSDPHPPPLLFPRSVSPYVSRRKCDDASCHQSLHQRFYSTPQVGPTYNSGHAAAASSASAKKKTGKFSLLSSLFRSRSEKLGHNSDHRISSGDSCYTASSASASPLWFSNIIPGCRKKQSRLFSFEEAPSAGRRHCRATDRGMSPARGFDSDYDCDDCDWSPSASGDSGDSPRAWRKTPMAGPAAGIAARRARAGHTRNVSGLAFCLSPLVRASPRQWSQKGGLPPDLAFSGEIRKTPHLSTATSFGKNRSRKLADFGRGFHHR